MGQTRTLMQEEISKIIEWASTWKIAINTDKTKAMIISSNTKETNSDPQLKSEYGEIATVGKYKFLAVMIDSGLRLHCGIGRGNWSNWSKYSVQSHRV